MMGAVGATEIVPRPTPASPPAERPERRRAATIPPPVAVAPSGSKGLLIGGGIAAAVVVLGIAAWLVLRKPEPAVVSPGPTMASGPSVPGTVAPAPPDTAPVTQGAAPATIPGPTLRPSVPPASLAPATAPPATAPPVTAAGPPLSAPPVTAPPVTQPSRAGQVNALLNQAENALLARNYDLAIAAYDEALKLDPQNAQARQGRTTSIQARTLATAALPTAGKLFVSGRTKASSAETRAAPSPRASRTRRTSPSSAARRPRELPGKMCFDVDPENVKAGDGYKVASSWSTRARPHPGPEHEHRHQHQRQERPSGPCRP